MVRLDGEECTLLLNVDGGQLPRLVYWGEKLEDGISSASLPNAHLAPVFQGGLDHPYQLNIFPEAGRGFRGASALLGERSRQNWANDFVFESVDHVEGGVIFSYEDRVAELQLTLECFLDQKSNVLQRRTVLTNSGATPYDLHFCAAASLPIPSYCSEIIKYHGCWTGEFRMETIPLSQGQVQVENRTGRTSHEFFPAMLAAEAGISETTGRVFGSHLAWSGNFRFLAEQVADGSKQLQCGELLFPGEKQLEPGETYCSPWSYSSCSKRGLNGLSTNFHSFFRDRIATPSLKKRSRPVQINTWEAVYFNHDLDELKEMAEKAAQLGIERFVLDDGWFHKRNDDTRALGDWWPDGDKYPDGLAPLANRVRALGMEFGLWFEPEMVNEESELYTKHPEWILSLDGFQRQRGRNQLVLNLALPEVAEYLFEKIDAILAQVHIDYVKWDMNRILTEPGYNGLANVSDQTHAFYNLVDRIRAKYPDLDIESCASGGGRVDYEVLKRTERFWASDSNDPFRRLQIQRGASLFFPPEVIGSHAGPMVCHTSGRMTTLPFRAAVALCCHFGFELNILELSRQEEQEMQEFIGLYKQYRNLLHTGTYHRLERRTTHRTSYGVVSTDLSEAVFFIHQCEIDDQSADRSVLLSGLDAEANYTIEILHSGTKNVPELSEPLPGKYLMEWGISVYMTDPGSCVIYRLVRTD